MEKFRFFVVILSTIFLSLKSFAQNLDGWQLVWSDEFNYEGLPKDSKWSYENGFVRGQEKQFYTYRDRNNCYVSKGCLHLRASNAEYTIPESFLKKSSDNWKRVNLQKANIKVAQVVKAKGIKGGEKISTKYTSASITTFKRASWQYGRFEFRAKLPYGKGVWPAIWLVGENRQLVGWPKCGEIDVMEYSGKNPTRVYSNVHYLDNDKKMSHSRSSPIEDSRAFHIYAVEWNSEKISFFADGKCYNEVSIDSIDLSSNPFRRKFYIIINLALGGAWGGEIDDSIFPQEFLVDYVRVYKKHDG